MNNKLEFLMLKLQQQPTEWFKVNLNDSDGDLKVILFHLCIKRHFKIKKRKKKIKGHVNQSEIPPALIQKCAMSHCKEGVTSVAAGFHSAHKLYLIPFA